MALADIGKNGMRLTVEDKTSDVSHAHFFVCAE